MDMNRFSVISGDTEIPGTSQVSETQPQPTVVGFQNTTPEDFANDINMSDSTAPTTAHKRPRYAAAAKSNTSQNTNVTGKNKNQKQFEEPKPTFKALYPRVERQIIIKHNTIITGDLYLASIKALKLVNNTMANHQDITSPPFIVASFRRDSTLALTTAPTHRNVDYNNYLAIVKDAPRDLKPEATLISRMTKSLVHGIPIFYTPGEVRKDIEIANPSVKLAETPRWLTSDENQGKQASTMVIAICGTATLKDLGESVIVARKRCTVETYLTFESSTQYNFC
jgi:hypothetical protein